MSFTYSAAARGFIRSALSMSGIGEEGAAAFLAVTAASLRVCSSELMLIPCPDCLAARVCDLVRGADAVVVWRVVADADGGAEGAAAGSFEVERWMARAAGLAGSAEACGEVGKHRACMHGKAHGAQGLDHQTPNQRESVRICAAWSSPKQPVELLSFLASQTPTPLALTSLATPLRLFRGPTRLLISPRGALHRERARQLGLQVQHLQQPR